MSDIHETLDAAKYILDHEPGHSMYIEPANAWADEVIERQEKALAELKEQTEAMRADLDASQKQLAETERLRTSSDASSKSALCIARCALFLSLAQILVSVILHFLH